MVNVRTDGNICDCCVQDGESSKPEEILHSTTDASDWKLELERVLPQLKLTVRTDNKVKFPVGKSSVYTH